MGKRCSRHFYTVGPARLHCVTGRYHVTAIVGYIGECNDNLAQKDLLGCHALQNSHAIDGCDLVEGDLGAVAIGHRLGRVDGVALVRLGQVHTFAGTGLEDLGAAVADLDIVGAGR